MNTSVSTMSRSTYPDSDTVPGARIAAVQYQVGIEFQAHCVACVRKHPEGSVDDAGGRTVGFGSMNRKDLGLSLGDEIRCIPCGALIEPGMAICERCRQEHVLGYPCGFCADVRP